jgi:RND family efflux transporter MFP subunit
MLLVLAGCGPSEEAPRPGTTVTSTQPPLQTELVEVKQAQVPRLVEVTGQVAAIYQATLSSRIQGTIEKILVREGHHVQKGQTLVVLDSRDLDAELARAKAEVENAKAQRDRMVELYRKDAVSKQELENATRSFKVAEANQKSVVAQLSYTVVKAPFDGVITEKKVEVGELASPGQTLLRMENPSELRLEATVAESDLRAVTLGAALPVVIDALGSEQLKGTVSQLLPAGDPQTHTFMVKVDLPKTPGVKSGMFGRLQLEKGTSQALVLPEAALVERGELSSVYAVGPDNVARLRWVKPGQKVSGTVEILSGLNNGERVLADGSKGKDGIPVQETTAVALPPQGT